MGLAGCFLALFPLLLASARPSRSPSCTVSRAGVTCWAVGGRLGSCPCDSRPPENRTGTLPRGSQGRVSRGQQRKPQDSPRPGFWGGVTRLHLCHGQFSAVRVTGCSRLQGRQTDATSGWMTTRPHNEGTATPQGGTRGRLLQSAPWSSPSASSLQVTGTAVRNRAVEPEAPGSEESPVSPWDSPLAPQSCAFLI